MKKQIILEYSIDEDGLHVVTVSTPHHQRFDIYTETNETLDGVCEQLIMLIGNDKKFFLDFFQNTGFSYDADKVEYEETVRGYTIGYDSYKEELKIIQLHTTDKYLGKGGQHIEFTAQTDSKNLKITSLLRTEWVDLPLLRIIKIEEGLYKTKKITCVLQTGDMTAYIPDEILDPNTQVNRDTIPLEIINFEQ